jgi:hypothetical protein
MILIYLFLAYLLIQFGMAIYTYNQDEKYKKENEEIMKYYYGKYIK